MANTVNWLLNRPWFNRRLFTIHGADPRDPYLRRWTLVRTRWGKLVLHQFCRSDADTCSLHDHPAAFVTLIVAGGYVEVMPAGQRWRPPGTLLYRPAAFRHRVDLGPTGRPAWSLVWFRRPSRAWGFWTLAGFLPFRVGMPPICDGPTRS